MQCHANAKLSVKGRELLVDRLEVAEWSLTQAAGRNQLDFLASRARPLWAAHFRPSMTVVDLARGRTLREAGMEPMPRFNTAVQRLPRCIRAQRPGIGTARIVRPANAGWAPRRWGRRLPLGLPLGGRAANSSRLVERSSANGHDGRRHRVTWRERQDR